MYAGTQKHRVTRAQSEDVKEKISETGEVFKSNVAQLLGVRGGERTSDIWKIRLQLTKPVTWVPLIWGACLQSHHLRVCTCLHETALTKCQAFIHAANPPMKH